MAGYEPRTLGQLSGEARGYFAAAIDGAQVTIWPNSFTVTGKVLAALGHEHELRRAWLYDQTFLSSCEDAILGRRAFELGLARIPGAASAGFVTLAAPDGTVVPTGLRFVRADGRAYRALAGAVAADDEVTLPIEADEIGAAGDAPAGTTLRRTSDVAGPVDLEVSGVVAAGSLTGGVDRETDEALRRRLLQRRRARVSGGSASDYEGWARETLPAVEKVFVEAFTDDPGAVWVQFTVSDTSTGAPTSPQVDAVQAYLSDPVRRPVTARVFVSAPTATPVDVTIDELSPDTPAVRAAVTAEIEAAIRDVAEPGKPSGPFRLRRGVIEAAIERAADGFVLVAPASGVNFAAGTMPSAGTVTFI